MLFEKLYGLSTLLAGTVGYIKINTCKNLNIYVTWKVLFLKEVGHHIK